MIETDNKLPGDINVVILIACAIKDGDKFYLQVIFRKSISITKLVESGKKQCKIGQNWWKIIKTKDGRRWKT